MAPKKTGGKKQADDWENEMGEVPDPVALPTQDAKDQDETAVDAVETNGEGDGMGGGLLAALRKNKDKRKKKGKVDNDFVEGEDPNGVSTPAEPALDEKAPEEANLEDEDVFASTTGKKGKGGKKDEKPAATSAPAEDDGDDGEGGVKSKKEKEREKKEREKQRKKEQVNIMSNHLDQ